jgi:serine/threonine protein kinase/tetratricopeptide (TPR) repeat protein
MNELELFAAAIAITDPGERASLLDRECAGRPNERQRIDQLLNAHFRSQPLLDQPAREHTGAYVPNEQPGAVIAGRYKLLESIGEGGMGTVWVAEQTQPVHRKVALKLIKAGMDSKSVVARFEAERQALAVMDHQNVAKVLDGGLTEGGRPFFVMEYVKGVPITEYCDASRLSVPERLRLFTQVCQAVQHAHQKGIIHRDLKPSNILVAPYDDKPVPKIIDFGLAKAMHQSLTERTLHTAHDSVLGTPLYMSPEQAQLNNLDVDTRSDIYSLGVLLYELLTGTTPLEKQRFKEAAWDEVRRIIREEEPPRPSTRLSSTNTLPSLAACRQTEPLKLTRQVRGELDWIVMKALEKDRTGRYETAQGFARDIERYLNDEPVQACPPSAAYRFRKFARRHKGPVLAAACIFLLLIAGITGTTAGLLEARRERDVSDAARQDAVTAQQAETEQRRLAQENERRAVAAAQAEKAAKETAEAREAETRAVLTFVENKIFAAARPDGWFGGLGHDVTLRRAVDSALPFVEESLKDQPLTEARLRNTLGSSYWFLGEAKLAAQQFEKARAIYSRHLGPDHPDTLHSMHGLVMCYNSLNRYTDARPVAEKTLAVRKAKLGADHPDTLWSMHDLANCYHGYDGFKWHSAALRLNEEALALRAAKLGNDHPDTLVSMSMVAVSNSWLRQFEKALELHAMTLRLRKAQLGADHPDTLWSIACVAETSSQCGRHSEAVKLGEEAVSLMKVKLGPGHPHTLRAMSCLADNYAALGRHQESCDLREHALPFYKAQLGHEHYLVVASMILQALDYAALGRQDEALKRRQEAATLMSAKHGPEHPETLRVIRGVAAHLNNQAWRLVAFSDTRPYSGRAIALVSQAIELAPKVPDYSNTLGVAHYRAGDWRQAIETLNKAMALGTAGNSFDSFFLAMAYWQIGEKDMARQAFAQGVQWMEENQPTNDELRRIRAETAELLMIEGK